jgi:hypothetical protein
MAYRVDFTKIDLVDWRRQRPKHFLCFVPGHREARKIPNR